MSVALVQVAVEVVESLIQREAGAGSEKVLSQTPLAAESGLLASLLENLGESDIRIGKRLQTPLAGVAPDMGMTQVPPGHQDAARRSADGRAGVELSEPHPFPGHPVQSGSLDQLLSVAAQVSVTEVVGQDEDQVGKSPRRYRTGKEKKTESDQEPRKGSRAYLHSPDLRSFTATLASLYHIVLTGNVFDSKKRPEPSSVTSFL